MTAYVVRLARVAEFVGIVSCDDPSDISLLVDEFCDPGDCEYAELPDGMIGAPGAAPTVPDKFVESEEDRNFLACSQISDLWSDALSGFKELEWEPVA